MEYMTCFLIGMTISSFMSDQSWSFSGINESKTSGSKQWDSIEGVKQWRWDCHMCASLLCVSPSQLYIYIFIFINTIAWSNYEPPGTTTWFVYTTSRNQHLVSKSMVVRTSPCTCKMFMFNMIPFPVTKVKLTVRVLNPPKCDHFFRSLGMLGGISP